MIYPQVRYLPINQSTQERIRMHVHKMRRVHLERLVTGLNDEKIAVSFRTLVAKDQTRPGMNVIATFMLVEEIDGDKVIAHQFPEKDPNATTPNTLDAAAVDAFASDVVADPDPVPGDASADPDPDGGDAAGPSGDAQPKS